MGNTKQALIKTNQKNFFKHWMNFTRPLHGLNKTESSTIALLLYNYFELKKDISNDDLAWKLVFDYDTKLKIKEELNFKTSQSLDNLLFALRKKNIIINNKINKSYIPIIDLDQSNTFSIVYKFEINE